MAALFCGDKSLLYEDQQTNDKDKSVCPPEYNRLDLVMMVLCVMKLTRKVAAYLITKSMSNRHSDSDT